MTDPLYRCENALKWIRTVALMHYLGGAFDPEHMRDIANMAADALGGLRELPDCDMVTAGAREKARKQAAMFSKLAASDD